MVSACAFDDQEIADEGVELESTEQAISSGWTTYTSDENAPIGCDAGSLITSVQCTGRYCDNVRAYCNPTPGTVGASYWTTYFSEEGTSSRTCSSGYWVTGIACKRSYCDDVSLQCTQLENVTARNCYWTGWVSEEGGGTLPFGAGYYAAGARCSGRYCDNLSFYVCQL